MPRYGETIRSMLPQDIPWFLPDHAIFFGAVYAVVVVLGLGLGYVIVKSIWAAHKECGEKSFWDPAEDCSEKH